MNCHQIPPAEINWISDSFVDPSGRVFEWQGEIYRMINSRHTPFWQSLFDKGIVQELVRRQLLVSSELTEYTLDVDELVIRHQRIPVVSYCFEWSPGMLKEAALLTLELCIRLAEKELTLQDGHPWNILFDGNHPVFVDLGSITPVRPDILWAPYQQFCNFFLFPLYLYSANCDRLARWLLRDYLYGVTDGDALTALPFSFKLFHPGRTLKIWGPMVLSKVLNHLPQQLRNQFLSFAKTANSNFSHRETSNQIFGIVTQRHRNAQTGSFEQPMVWLLSDRRRKLLRDRYLPRRVASKTRNCKPADK